MTLWLMNDKETLAVVWNCDKKDCLRSNYRPLPEGETIASDVCDHCERRIKEPIWEEVSADINKEEEI